MIEAIKFTNYRAFSPLVTDYIVLSGEHSIEKLKNNLETGQNVIETLYILDKMYDKKTADIAKLYPTLSKYNKTNDVEVQAFLAGIYRKTHIPDAFGPLVAMLIKNSINPPKTYFDPNEEIGGAILSYLA